MRLHIATNAELDSPRVCLPRARETRHALRYSWIEICFNPEAAKKASPEEDAFQQGLSWYAAFRWFHGNKNPFLDNLLDNQGITPEPVSKKDFYENRRTWVKWLRSYGW